MIVTALLCLEALSGQGQLDTIEVLRMVSASERDLLRKRVLLAPRSQLVESGAVVLEDGFGDKNLTGVAHLADWVTERLVDGSLRSNRRIQSDERIEFHRYLSNLDGSEDFFRKLD